MANLAYVDSSGRILIDGYHVGWVRREASLEAIEELVRMVTRPYGAAPSVLNRSDMIELA
ncbi:hypothetical protein LMTR13_07830 [Bradyrhizobium icense]|uniref:Uncharacterized protein n=1 Tax=Bradyrhizobium icense TaxID=1274631 RepID=A0A1B1UBH9_9BRAD|nr:hypothetical protein LMTR13_07830 [Bradyrhizobium icense]